MVGQSDVLPMMIPMTGDVFMRERERKPQLGGTGKSEKTNAKSNR
jgi:hypothetical protein